MKVAMIAALALTALAGVALANPKSPMGERAGPGERLMRADANQDGRVTKDEVRTQRTAAFERMDADKDGFLTTADRGEAKRPKAGGRGQAGLDADGDGKVSRAEFVDRGFEMFDRIDANKDGAIDQTELQAARERRRG